jgi:DNA-binding transcriptional regulator YiaG
LNKAESAGNETIGMKKTRNRTPTSDAIEIIHRRFCEGRPSRIAAHGEAQANDNVARQIYKIRKSARVTQRELARMVGTTTSVISRLEDADYTGHSLAMLRRIARALNKRVELRFVDLSQKTDVA